MKIFRTKERKLYASISIISLAILFLTISVIVSVSGHTLNEMEQSIQSHFSDIDTTNLTCYDMSELAKNYIETEYNYPVIFVHGEITRNLRSLEHTWLMVKVDGVWHEFESTRLEFVDVSNSFEIEYMTC